MPLSSFSAAGTITADGKLELLNRRQFARSLATMRRGPVTVEVAIARSRHSQKARSYYRGSVLRVICDHTGDEPNDFHELMKRRFTTPIVKTIHGEEFEIYSTAENDSQEFYDFVESVRRFALIELQVETEDPDPRWKEKVEKERTKQLAAKVDAVLAAARI